MSDAKPFTLEEMPPQWRHEGAPPVLVDSSRLVATVQALAVLQNWIMEQAEYHAAVGPPPRPAPVRVDQVQQKQAEHAEAVVRAFARRKRGGWTAHRVAVLEDVLSALASGPSDQLLAVLALVWADSYARLQPGPAFHALPREVQDWALEVTRLASSASIPVPALNGWGEDL